MCVCDNWRQRQTDWQNWLFSLVVSMAALRAQWWFCWILIWLRGADRCTLLPTQHTCQKLCSFICYLVRDYSVGCCVCLTRWYQDSYVTIIWTYTDLFASGWTWSCKFDLTQVLSECFCVSGFGTEDGLGSLHELWWLVASSRLRPFASGEEKNDTFVLQAIWPLGFVVAE